MKIVVAEAAKLVHDLAAIPEAEVLDTVLRAEAAADRNISRAMDRFERLQRRRKGRTVPPPSVRFTR